MPSRFVWMPSRKDGLGTRMVYREAFLQIQRRLLQHLIRRNWIHGVQEYQNRFTPHRRWRMIIKHQFRIRGASLDRQPEIQSSLVRSDFSLNYRADQQRLQISDLLFDKFTTQATFACWKKRFKTEVCTCSKFPTEAVLWIKEVELVDSVDGLKSSCSVRGIQMPNFEALDARIASCKSFVLLGYGAKNESNHLAEGDQLYQVKLMIKRNRQRVVLDLLPNTKCARSSAFFGEPLVQMTTPHVALNCLVNCLPSVN